MAENKVKFKLGNAEVDAWDVPIQESTERWTEIKLEDGAVLRLKVVVSNVYRVEGRTDDQGNPMYAVRSTNALVTVSGPTPKTNGEKVQ
jgi:hypothetical protein